MAIKLGDKAPDFVVETTQGTIRFREWKRDRWAVLFSHPADFTPVCTTELAAMATLTPEFEKRDTMVMALSVDPLDFHYRWLSDVESLAGTPVRFPMAADPHRWVANLYGMIHPSAGGQDTVRSLFLIDPLDRIKLMLAYPAGTGRNFEELLRVIDSLQSADED
jgi:alkyl hydroperoxide reductase subunit AhpC